MPEQHNQNVVDVRVDLELDSDGDYLYRASTADEHLMGVSSSILRIIGGLGVAARQNSGPDVRVRFEMSADVVKRVNSTNDA